MISIERIEDLTGEILECYECSGEVPATTMISIGDHGFRFCAAHALAFLAPFVDGNGAGALPAPQGSCPESQAPDEYPTKTTVSLPSSCAACAIRFEKKSDHLSAICRRCELTRARKLRKKIESHHGIIVLMDIEFGYKSKFWLVPMTADEFERWWAAQESFGAPAGLCRLIMEYPLRSVVLPGERIMVQTNEEVILWDELLENGRSYSCHFFDDEFTYLTTPDGKRIHHKGYCGRDTTR